MPRQLRQIGPAGAVLGLAVVGLALTWGPRSWPARRAAPDPPARAALDLDGETWRSGRLEELRSLVLHKIGRKEAVVTALIAGRLRLADAVREVRAIEDDYPELREQTRRYLVWVYPGRPLEEVFARNLVDRSVLRLRDDPARAAAVRGRLTAELAAFLDSRPKPTDTPAPAGVQ